MSRVPIVVARTGSPFYVSGDGLGARGEFDTRGIVDMLADSGLYDVTYFGRVVGDTHWRSDVRVIEPCREDVDEHSAAGELTEKWEPALSAVRELAPVACVNIAGSPTTWCWPDNPAFSSVRAFGVRYTAPSLWLMHSLGIPRILVVTDPKTYPRDGEMATMWPDVAPAAVLSQEQRSFPRTVQGVEYAVHAAYAACENWNTHGARPVLDPPKELLISTCANTHIGSRLRGDRLGAWDRILRPALEAHERVRVCGHGWDEHPLYAEHRRAFVGELRTHAEVRELLSLGVCGPMISQCRGFSTTKARLHALCGSAPVFWAGDHDTEYDAARRLPFVRRFGCGEELRAYALGLSDDERAETVSAVLERTEPDMSLLHDCIAAVARGEDRTSPEWLRRYGGYRRA